MNNVDSFDRGPFFKGVENMLINCAAAAPGDKVLIVHENATEGYYDAEMLQEVVTVSRRLGLFPALYEVPFNRDVTEPDPDLSAQISIADRTLFLARIGDQLRFNARSKPDTQIVSYALDRDMLSSGFGTADYRAFDGLKRLINTMMADADKIQVSCPLGTDFSGRITDLDVEHGDTSIKRFPLSVFKPADANGFVGRIAQAGFLVGTGSNYYSPYACPLDDTLFVSFENNTITGFEGSNADVAAATAHYERVGKAFGIDPYFVHSWHGGIHPGCGFADAASKSFERWSGGAFGNPRILHFHTCGAYPPGEISLNVIDPTIRIDGVAVWEDGILFPDRVPGGADLMRRYPCAAKAFANPDRRVGLGQGERLSFL